MSPDLFEIEDSILIDEIIATMQLKIVIKIAPHNSNCLLPIKSIKNKPGMLKTTLTAYVIKDRTKVEDTPLSWKNVIPWQKIWVNTRHLLKNCKVTAVNNLNLCLYLVGELFKKQSNIPLVFRTFHCHVMLHLVLLKELYP